MHNHNIFWSPVRSLGWIWKVNFCNITELVGHHYLNQSYKYISLYVHRQQGGQKISNKNSFADIELKGSLKSNMNLRLLVKRKHSNRRRMFNLSERKELE